MASHRHEELVAQIVGRHGAQTSGFRRAMLKLLADALPADANGCQGCEENPCVCATLYAEQRKRFADHFSFRPDAFLVDADSGEVLCWEVHVTGIAHHKLKRYEPAFFALDEHGYTLHLIHVDQFGQEYPVDVFAGYMRRTHKV